MEEADIRPRDNLKFLTLATVFDKSSRISIARLVKRIATAAQACKRGSSGASMGEVVQGAEHAPS